eukprot:GHVR01056655.1.p1 GENE.GHVR01056655.1~~GHVR01056655.1.p1  ORF type:complete len:257 (+),score=21.69 GHVR01056655.1:199-969(+)
MAKLIGTDPNQVPTNADLGTMAYQDAERPALGQTTVKSAGTALIVERTGDASNLQFKSDGQNVGHIYGFKNGSGGDLAFYPTNSSGSITQRMIINRDGNVTINDGNLVLANGHGIDFSATAGTGSSELLDDYEEGTWTPSFGGSTVNPTVTYSSQRGTYVKMGGMVIAHFKMNWTAWSVDGSGYTTILGLPFTSKSGSGWYTGSISETGNGLVWGSGYTQVSVEVVNGGTTMAVTKMGSQIDQAIFFPNCGHLERR